MKDHKNNYFKNLEEMLDAYAISEEEYERRVENGWSLKDSLETPDVSYEYSQTKIDGSKSLIENSEIEKIKVLLKNVSAYDFLQALK